MQRMPVRLKHGEQTVGHTNDGGYAFVAWYRFFVVALAPLERLGEVDRRLV
jgi:hypothetical protein